MGTPDFAREVLEGLIDSDYDVIAVITQPDRPVGRKRVLTPPPAKELALQHNIPVYQPEKLGQSQELTDLMNLEADLIVTAAYGQFVPTKLLDAPVYGSINVHASLLPKYRGGAPIHYAIRNGDEETGVSIIYMTKEMDAGDILSKRSIPIEPTDDVGSMFNKLATLGTELLLETLPRLFAGEIEAQSQDPDLVTYSPIIRREEEQLDWERPAQAIDWHVRGFRPFPSTFTWLKNERVKVWDGQPLPASAGEDYPTGSPGEIVAVDEDQLIVQCGENTYYAIRQWQESGKPRMAVSQYLNGVQESDILHQVFHWKD